MTSPAVPPWSVVEPLLDELLDLETAARERRLLELAVADRPLAERLASLLGADRSVLDLDAASLLALVTRADTPGPGAAGAPPAVDGYVRLVRVGVGAAAEVFRAEPRAGGPPVALKLLRREVAGGALARRFLAEGKILATLSHPGIVRFLGVGETADGRPYLVTEWVEGESLRAWMARAESDLEARVGRIAEVCEALAWAHASGVAHRDVKPSNVLVGADGRARLLDFGIAALIAEGGDRASSSDLWVFTLDYAAPEQLRGQPVGPPADVYGVGLLLFEAATGNRLWNRSGRPLALVLSGLAAERPPGGGLVDRRFGRLVRACLRPDPARRPAASEVADELREWLATPAAQRSGRSWWSKKSVIRR